MSTCLGKMMIEGEQELAPQFKRMKLTSDNSQGYDIYKAHLIGHDLYNELKMVCPYFTEEQIKEIVEKSENNTESAKRMIHEMNKQESLNNKNFVNLHQQNRKRKFNEMCSNNFETHNFKEHDIATVNRSNPFASNFQPLPTPQERKKFQVKPGQDSSHYLTDEDLENFLTKLEKSNSREEMKNLLSDFLSKEIAKSGEENPNKKQNPFEQSHFKITPNTNNTFNANRHLINPFVKEKDESLIQKNNFEEIKKINENLITDNTELKKCVVTLYRKVEADKKLKDENNKFRNQIEILQEEILKEKSRNQSMAMLMRQYENSPIFFDNKNIY